MGVVRKGVAIMVDGGQTGGRAGGSTASVSFKLGEKFYSFDELEAKLDLYKKEAFVELWRRDCRTIEAARKRGVDRPLKPELKYFQLKYCCVHGGQKFKPRGDGKRLTS